MSAGTIMAAVTATPHASNALTTSVFTPHPRNVGSWLKMQANTLMGESPSKTTAGRAQSDGSPSSGNQGRLKLIK